MKYTTMRVEKKDLEFLEKLRDKMRKRAASDVLHSIIKLIKEQKSEGELKWQTIYGLII